jgi:hypothetical protein
MQSHDQTTEVLQPAEVKAEEVAPETAAAEPEAAPSEAQ